MPFPDRLAALVWPERPDGLVARLDPLGCLGGQAPLGGSAWLICRGSSLEVHARTALPDTLLLASVGAPLRDVVDAPEARPMEYPVTAARHERRGRGVRALDFVVLEAWVPLLSPERALLAASPPSSTVRPSSLPRARLDR